MGNFRPKTRKGSSTKGEEYYSKKLHACKIQLKRAIKKGKDAEIRKVVKSLKKAKDSEPTLVGSLEEKLYRTKSIDIAQIWSVLCADGSQEELDEDSIRVAKSQIVCDHVQALRDIEKNLQEAKMNPVMDSLPSKPEEVQLGDSPMAEEKTEKADAKDAIPKSQDKVKKKKPKNRMGQRARQRLAEKLHGVDAKHKSIEKKKDQVKKVSEPPLHPSWAAKKESKDMLAIHLDKPAGKKIVFD